MPIVSESISSTYGFRTVPPILWVESTTEVVKESIAFHYQLNMDPGCDRFAKDLKTMDWCSNMYEAYVYFTLRDRCRGSVTEQKHNRKEGYPVTGTVSIAGAVTVDSGSLKIVNRISTDTISNRKRYMNTSVAREWMDRIGIMRQDIVKVRDELLMKDGFSAGINDYVEATVMLAGKLRVFFIAYYAGQIRNDGLHLLNITLASNTPPDHLIPASCVWNEAERLLDLHFYQHIVSNTDIVFEALPFRLYSKYGSEICLLEYAGSQMMTREQNLSCEATLEKGYNFIMHPIKKCQPLQELWISRGCKEEDHYSDSNIIQVKPFSKGIFVYCNGFRIEKDNKTYPCPPEVIVLPPTTSFRINKHSYSYDHLEHVNIMMPDSSEDSPHHDYKTSLSAIGIISALSLLLVPVLLTVTCLLINRHRCSKTKHPRDVVGVI